MKSWLTEDFTISEELYLPFCILSIIPPGTWLKSEMTSTEVKKTKDVANLRIHVERAINYKTDCVYGSENFASSPTQALP